MIQNNNIYPLPFYTDIKYQNHRKKHLFGQIYPILCRKDFILPFQIIRETSANEIDSVILHQISTGDQYDITGELKQKGLEIIAKANYDIIKYSSFFSLIPVKRVGAYYLEISDTVNTWYSEVFSFTDGFSELLKITYYDRENFIYNELGEFDYSNNFKFNLFFDTNLGYPEYKLTEEVEENDGYTLIERQISEKVYKAKFLACEMTCDALQIVQMSDFVTIESDGIEYNAETIHFKIDWENGGAFASVELEFELSNPIKKIGRGYLPLGGNGDFNSDFNNDFLNN